MTDSEEPFELPGSTRIGRVTLRVGSLDRMVPFYRGLGFEVDREGRNARLAPADGRPLVTLEEDPDLPQRPPDAAGLFHFAVRVPDRGALADVLERIRDAGLELTGASDHLVSEALYLRDPEGNGVEVYRDLPREEWPRTDDGRIDLDSLPLDLDDLSAGARGTRALPAGTDIGHVHLEVTDLDRARAFYTDRVGLRVQAPRYRDTAAFLAAGDYHHHLGLNTWNGRSAPAGETRGLDRYEIVLPDRETLSAVRDRFDGRDGNGGLEVADPDGIRIRLTVAG